MLRDAGVRTKLLAVLAIPTVLLVVVTALLVSAQVGVASRARAVGNVLDVATQVGQVVHSLQDERGATLRHLEIRDPASEDALQEQRQRTDREIDRLRDLVAAADLDATTDSVRTALDRVQAGHTELAGARASVDAQRFFATEADVFYRKVIRSDLDLPGVLAASTTPELAQWLNAYETLSTTIEYTAHERDVVAVGLVAGSMNEAEFAQAVALVDQQRQHLQDFRSKAEPAAYARLDAALADAANYEIDQVRRNLSTLLLGRPGNPEAAQEWTDAAQTRIDAMTRSEQALAGEIGLAADQVANAQERRSLALVVLAAVGLGLALLLATGLARRITRPLRRLTSSAAEIGDELPRMVERMQTPGEGPGVTVEPIRVESADEIGRLAQAFNTVNEVTVRVAEEQAALRAGIAEMFVNVARRNQVLLGRQLKALDEMEAREEDPDVLQRLFGLDHLATRMRRNAESLLVLAGIDSTRRLRSAMPLSDVIRTAVGEIEDYERIELSMTDDPDVSGRHALTLAHLLAELLENATHFSDPETRVIVSAAVTAHGVDVTVTDHGLGMSEEDIAAAEERIAHPPVTEIAVSQRVGHMVVGRLAARLGAQVSLRRGRSAGLAVTTHVPAEVFVGLVVAPADEPATVAAPEGVAEVPEVVEVPEALVVPDAVEEPAEVVEDVAVEEPVVAEADLPEAEGRHARPSMFSRFRRRGPASQTDADVAVDAEVDDDADTEADTQADVTFDETPVALEPVPAQLELEPLPVAPDPEPEPVAVHVEPEREPLPVVAEPEPEPVAVHVEPEPEPEPEPAMPMVFAAAVDVLPRHAPVAGRFARHRSPLPRRRPAAAPVVHAPAGSPQVPVADIASATAPVEPSPVRPAPAPAVEQPAVPVVAAAVASDLASSAISELRGLYEPAAASTTNGAALLTRRTPKAAAPEPVTVPAAPRRERTATEVRGMLAGFRAGVERGRTSEPDQQTEPTDPTER